MPAGVGPGAPQPGNQPAGPGFLPPPVQPWPAFPQQPSLAGAPPAPAPTAPISAPFGAPLPPVIPSLGSAGPATPLAPPVGPLTPIQSPASYPGFQPPVAPAPPAPAPEGKRGKPKRRRFNLSVLEGLEKKIQSLPASLPRSATTAEPTAPPAGLPVPPLAPSAPVPPPPAAPAYQPPVSTAFTAPARSAPADSPASTPGGRISEAGPAKSGAEPEAQPAEPVESAETVEKPSRSKSARDRRAAMRSMMFGEEPGAVTQPAPPQSSSAPAAEEHEAAPVPADMEPAPDAFAPAAQAAESDQTAQPPLEEARAEEPAFAFTPAPDDGQAAGDQPTSITGWQAETPAETPATSDADESASWTAVPGFESADHRGNESDFGLEPVATEPEPSSMDRSEPAPVEAGAAASQGEPEPESAPAFAGEYSGEDTATAGEAPPAPPEESKPGAGTMVIIEDDAAVGEYYATLFRGNGYRVEVATDGTSGVDLCVKVQPDVILLDVMMPRQNGILVLQTLRASEETRNTPVVVLSNFSEPTLIKRALQLGALEYVIKTQVEGSALLQAVPRWMSREKAFAAA
jgi:CheY-like chemotaxis protein